MLGQIAGFDRTGQGSRYRNTLMFLRGVPVQSCANWFDPSTAHHINQRLMHSWSKLTDYCFGNNSLEVKPMHSTARSAAVTSDVCTQADRGGLPSRCR